MAPPTHVDDPGDIPALLRVARGSYSNTIVAFLAAAGFEDLPRNGPFVLGGMANHGGSAVDMIRGLGVSRQAASQLIDTLVLRGYLTREVNAGDRRRMDIELTERGRAAAAVVRAAVEQVDRELCGMLSPSELAGLRAGLAALGAIKERTERDAGQAEAAKPKRGPEPGHDQVAFEFAAALKHGDLDRVRALLAGDPALATSVINSRPPLHLFADAPGHRPNAAGVVTALVEAGADPDAHALDTWHHETALHWAASNDDLELIDALLDAGADIEHPGSSIDGGPPIQSALGYAQWAALRRLYERGAKIGLSHAAVLGLMPLVAALVEAHPAPGPDDVSIAFWNACRAGQLTIARYLAGRGAELNWAAPWSGETPLDAASQQHQRDVVAWLVGAGASSGS